MNKLLSKNFVLFSILIFLSLLLFRGRIGSDDLEVFNFVYNFKNFDGNFFEYLSELKELSLVFAYSDDLQKHTYYTWHHRFIWVIQTYVIYTVIDFFNLFFKFNTFFFHKYFSGLILTFYSVFSFFLCLKYFHRKNLDLIFCFLLSTYIFFSTGLIAFFTGQYIESLAILLLILRIYINNNKIIFCLDFLLILIKPFYFLIIFFLRINELNFKNIFSKNNYLIFIKIGILILLFIFFRILITDFQNNLSYASSQNPNFDFLNYLKNFVAFYFSHGSGVFFTLLPLAILIYFGWEKKTKYKIFSIIVISFILSIYDGSHGSVSGGRYSLPFFIIFLDEYAKGFKMILKKNKSVIIIISILTFLNLPSLEYRNFIISEYQNETVLSKKPLGPVKIEVTDNEVKFLLYDWPINNIKFNNIIFSNLVLYSKLFNKQHVEINKDLILQTDLIFPQTGIARLIYLNNIKIDSGHKFINFFANKFSIYLKIIYIITVITFLTIYFLSIFKALKFRNNYE